MAIETSRANPVETHLIPRVLVLLTTLAVVKGAVVAQLNEHLFQTHWRTRLLMPDFLDYANYFLFPVIGFLTLTCFARENGMKSPRRVAVAHFWIVFMGLAHVCLSFHEGDFNYMVPLMEGIIDASDLWAYLSMNLFFRSPYLFLWLFSYALVSWFNLRSQKPERLFYWTGLMGCAYFLVNQRFLLIRGDELMVVNCIGIGCLLGFKRSGQSYQPAWLLVPGLLLLGGFFLFRPFHGHLMDPDPYFRFLLKESILLTLVTSLYAWRFEFFRPWSYFAPFYLAALFLFTSHHYPYAVNYNHFIIYLLSLPRVFWQECLMTACFALVAWRLLQPKTYRGWIVCDLVVLVMVCLAVADWAVLKVMDARLDWSVLMMADSFQMGWRMAAPYAGPFLLAMSAWLAVYYGLIYLLTRPFYWTLRTSWNRWLEGSHPMLYAFVLIGLTGLFLMPGDKSQGTGFVELVRTSPWYASWTRSSMDPEELGRTAQELKVFPSRFAQGSSERDAPPEKPLNLFLIVLESMYNKHLSLFNGEDETQPMLKKHMDRMELFPRYFGNYPTSGHARITCFTSLYGTRRYLSETNPKIPVSTLFEVLHEHGYRNALFDSCFLNYASFKDFIRTRKLDIIHDADSMPGQDDYERVSWGLLEECTREAILSQLEVFAQSERPFSLTYLPVAPHYPYDHADPRFLKFEAVESGLQGDYTNQYKNQLLYMDWILTSLLDALDQMGLLDKTLVVITNDHGEMLGDEGGKIGHGWSLDPDLTNLPLIVMNPKKTGYRVNETIGSHIDLMPTVLDLLDIPLPANEFYQGISLYSREAGMDRVVYLTSHSQTALIEGEKYILDPHPEPVEGNPAIVYRIEADGHRTRFIPTGETESIAGRMKRFIEFQESLLQEYGFYKNNIDVIRRNYLSSEKESH